MADRGTPSAALIDALRVVHRAGLDHVGVVYTRSDRAVALPGDPPEAYFVIPSDLRVLRIDLAACPVSDMPDWPAARLLAPKVCVGLP
jgi:hypothetical protein